jgi:hypothetical protein
MPYVRQRATVRLAVLVLASVCALAVAGAASAEFPTKRSDPSISGTPQEGQTLNGRTGQWLMDNGLNCTDCTFTYTWQRCNADLSGCADVPGRTGYTYLLGPDDVGKRLRFVEWVYKRDCGAHNTQTGQIECRDVTKNGASQPTLTISPKPVTIAQASNAPAIRGVPMEEEILTATGATWSGPGTITKAIFWQRCNTAGEGCATIPGAIGPAYRVKTSDVGGRIRVIETATNEGGTAQAVSPVTAVVEELMPTAARPTISVAKVALPHRLMLGQVVTRQSGSSVTVRVKVSDDRGFRVTGVRVWLTPTGLLSGSRAVRISDRNGWATFRYRATGRGTTYVYADARRKGEKAQEGISTANLFRIRVR